MADIIFEELTKEEKTLLLRAFEYDIDEEGYVIDSSGSRLASKEVPNAFIHIDKAALTPGSLNIIDGTPTSISEFIREKLEKPNDPRNTS